MILLIHAQFLLTRLITIQCNPRALWRIGTIEAKMAIRGKKGKALQEDGREHKEMEESLGRERKGLFPNFPCPGSEGGWVLFQGVRGVLSPTPHRQSENSHTPTKDAGASGVRHAAEKAMTHAPSTSDLPYSPSYAARFSLRRFSACATLSLSFDTSSAACVGARGTGLASVSRPARFLSISSRRLCE